jgi:hypothetical protein
MLGPEQLVHDIARLRRAQRRNPDDEDLAAVRLDLERMAGPTLSRAAASRLLGVSQTAFDRWVATGAIPVVLTPRGRREIPVEVVLELVDEVASSSARRPLAAVLRAREAVTRSEPQDGPRPHGHRTAEQRGLAYHRVVARRLDDRIVADALARLRRWRASGRIHPRYAAAWEDLLTGPRARLRRALVADGDEAVALRQSSPLAGTLSEPERRRALGLA